MSVTAATPRPCPAGQIPRRSVSMSRACLDVEVHAHPRTTLTATTLTLEAVTAPEIEEIT